MDPHWIGGPDSKSSGGLTSRGLLIIKEHSFNGTYVSTGSLPAGSRWAMNPNLSIESGIPSFVPR